MKKLLLVILTISDNTPQPIRFRNLIRFISDHYKVTILTKDEFINKDDFNSRTEIIRIPYSKIGNLLITRTNPSSSVTDSNHKLSRKSKLLGKIKLTGKKIWQKSGIKHLIFPDKFIFELHSFKKALKSCLTDEVFDYVIISTFPFSLMPLSKCVKDVNKDIFCLLDTGDPFFGNSGTQLIKPLKTKYAKWFEKKYFKHFDHIIVPTEILKEHYLANYPFKSTDDITVIEQGLPDLFVNHKIERKINKISNTVTLIYAGGFYKILREPYELYAAVRELKFLNIKLNIYGSFNPVFLPPSDDPRFRYNKSVSQDVLLEKYLDADIVLFIDNAFGVQVPGKILEILSLQKPILFIYENDQSPSLKYLENYKAAEKVRNNKEDIKRGLQDLVQNHHRLDCHFNVEPYLWNTLAIKYINLFQKKSALHE